MLSLVNENLPSLIQIHKDNRSCAGNLLHYLGLRRHDIRNLQERLAALGLSSLGRTEAYALNAVRTVVGVLSRLNQNPTAASGHFSSKGGRQASPRSEHRNPPRARS
jgi:pyruvate kinase